MNVKKIQADFNHECDKAINALLSAAGFTIPKPIAEKDFHRLSAAEIHVLLLRKR